MHTTFRATAPARGHHPTNAIIMGWKDFFHHRVSEYLVGGPPRRRTVGSQIAARLLPAFMLWLEVPRSVGWRHPNVWISGAGMGCVVGLACVRVEGEGGRWRWEWEWDVGMRERRGGDAGRFRRGA
jgi:hypothetical protein